MANIQHIVTRFAPSPTGALHLGHAYSALMGHDAARECVGGRFLLRIDDIDQGRSRPEYVDAIYADLDWMGLCIDGSVVFQSSRKKLYATALDRLRAMGLTYPCFCTRAEIAAEIAASASAPHAGPDGPNYPGTCKAMSETQRESRMKTDAYCWRINMDAALHSVDALSWRDRLVGDQIANPAQFGDIVLARKDAGAAYHLATVIDDADMGVTLVVRGRDLFAATNVHRLLQALLDLPVPDYCHHALVLDDKGKRLAKRNNAASLAAFRQIGLGGPELVAMMRAEKLPFGFELETA